MTAIPRGARFTFIDDDCRRAQACVCGLCKWWVHVGGEIVQSCDYGDCRRTATGNCPRFGYPVCDRHAHANCCHAKGGECRTQRIRYDRPSPTEAGREWRRSA